MKRIIIICVIVVIVVLAYAIFVFNLDWVYMLMLVSTSFITSIITSLIINKKERHQEPNPTLPYNAPDSHPLIDMKTEVIPVKREMNSAMKSYIEFHGKIVQPDGSFYSKTETCYEKEDFPPENMQELYYELNAVTPPAMEWLLERGIETFY